MSARSLVAYGLASFLSMSLTLGAQAQAQDEDAEAERTQFVVSAQEARDAGDAARALTLARAAAAIRMSTSLRLFIAQQEALADSPVAAIGEARTCVAEAEADAEMNHRDTILSTCQELVAQLAQQLGSITISPLARPDGLVVRVDSEELSAGRFGAPIDRRPGAVLVEATAPGFAPYRETVEVEAGAIRSVEIALTESGSAAPDELEAPDAPPSPGGAEAGPSPAWIALPAGLAVALGIASAVTGALTLDARARYDELAQEPFSADVERRAMDVASEGSALRDATNALWITAAVAGLAALVTALLVDWDGSAESARRFDGSVRF